MYAGWYVFLSPLFSSLSFRTLISYSATIEASVFLSQAVWLFRTRNIRQRAKEAELQWEEFPEAQAWQENRWKFHRDSKSAIASTVDGAPHMNAAEDLDVVNQKAHPVQCQNEDIET